MEHARQAIAIIGSGFSGLCIAIQLKKAGIHTFTIYEKSDRLGGTWRDNIYPGACCDIAAITYCFSFEPKADWSSTWAPQEEILAYLEACSAKYGIDEHIRYGTEIESATFEEDSGTWALKTADGEAITATVLITGTGQLNRPYIPEFPGLADFAGECFHSARWNINYDLEGKRVAVIGNAASAVQFVPEIAKKAGLVCVFQRSANWILPRGARPDTAAEPRSHDPRSWRGKLKRWQTFLRNEAIWPLFKGNGYARRQVEKTATNYIRTTVNEEALQDAQIPDYPPGARRILLSDDYYETLNQANVEVVLDGVDHLTTRSIVTGAGREVPVDAVIFATGFQSTDFLAPIRIEGLSGRQLDDVWEGGARGYYGITLSGFPNFFMMYGPNTNLGHNSIVFMIECQSRYIMQCIQLLFASEGCYLDLKQEILDNFDHKTQRELANTVWAHTGHSWYKRADGRITNNWPGSTIRYWWNTRRAKPAHYRRVPHATVAPPQA